MKYRIIKEEESFYYIQKKRFLFWAWYKEVWSDGFWPVKGRRSFGSVRDAEKWIDNLIRLDEKKNIKREIIPYP
jgi:hypothetical protein